MCELEQAARLEAEGSVAVPALMEPMSLLATRTAVAVGVAVVAAAAVMWWQKHRVAAMWSPQWGAAEGGHRQAPRRPRMLARWSHPTASSVMVAAATEKAQERIQAGPEATLLPWEQKAGTQLPGG